MVHNLKLMDYYSLQLHRIMQNKYHKIKSLFLVCYIDLRFYYVYLHMLLEYNIKNKGWMPYSSNNLYEIQSF